MSVFDWRGPSQIAKKLQNDALAATKSKSGWKLMEAGFTAFRIKPTASSEKRNPEAEATGLRLSTTGAGDGRILLDGGAIGKHGGFLLASVSCAKPESTCARPCCSKASQHDHERC